MHVFPSFSSLCCEYILDKFGDETTYGNARSHTSFGSSVVISVDDW